MNTLDIIIISVIAMLALSLIGQGIADAVIKYKTAMHDLKKND